MSKVFVVLFSMEGQTLPAIFSNWDKMQQFTKTCRRLKVPFACYEETVDRYQFD